MTAMTINGKDALTHASFDVINPSTGEVHAQAPDATREQLDDAMSSAAAAFTTWRKDEGFRVQKMRELAKAMAEAAPAIAADLAAENGKTAELGMMESIVASAWLDYFAALEVPREIIRDDDEAMVEVLRKPLGVVGAITPWNIPVGLAFWKIAPALRAGNTVVVKPSPYTPLSALRFGQIAREILPPGVLNVVTGGDELGKWITSHPVPRKISFTGSVAAGKHVAVSAAEDLKRVTLELGGNDPAIVLEDADISQIAMPLFWSALFNNGQGCCLVKRVYAPESRYDELVEALAAIAGQITVGNPIEQPDVNLGPLATKFQYEKVSRLVEDAVAHGATIAAGGRPSDGRGYFYRPTILAGVSDGVGVVDEEQFGPVLPIVKYSTLDDALERVNAGTYGLGASVWTSDVDRGAEVGAQIDAGTTWINAHAALAPNVPFGGHRWSGLGVENGPWGLYSFTDIQVIHRNRGGGTTTGAL